jgi:hypothetical protein
MHVANLQLQGLLIAIAAMNRALVRKGILSAGEIDEALREAEASFAHDGHVQEDMSPSNRDAVCFPIRLLQAANLSQSDSSLRTFEALARDVGESK